MNKIRKMVKEENKVLIMLAFFSISIGLWGNFRQLWLQDNNLNVSQISNILSLATFLCSIAILFFTKWMTLSKIRSFIFSCLIVKVVNLVLLFFLNGTGIENSIRICCIIDVLTEKLIILSIYPLLITIKKSDTLYSKRKLVEYLFRDIGILVGGVLIGNYLFKVQIGYNTLLLIATLFLAFAGIIMKWIPKKQMQERDINQRQKIQHIMKDNISKWYFAYYVIGNISMNIALGLKMLMLTNMLEFSASNATNYLLVIGLIADAIGILALKYFTPKNDYITVMIKFGLRMVAYFLVLISNSYIMTILAISWSILISTAYENIVDAPYINRIKNEYQLLFTNIRYAIGILAESLGLLLAGMIYPYGIRYMLGIAAILIIIQIGIACILIYKRHKEGKIYKNNKYKEQGITISYYSN